MRRLVWTIIFTCLAAAVVPAAGAELDSARFATHCRALTATPHRLAGTPEARRAGDYIEAELRRLDGQLLVQRFSFPQEIAETCELRLPTGVIELGPMRANGLQPSVTSREGLTADVFYIGKGTLADVSGMDLDGAIVIADFKSEAVIATVLPLGARAVIFVGDESDDRLWAEAKRTTVSIDIPRFYLERAVAEKHGLLAPGKTQRATLMSRVRWEKRFGRNILLWLPGADPVFKKNPEYIILSASYDSGGLVPSNSPDPERAANCAGLLETARLLAADRPRRSVMVAFFDNHVNFLEGGRRFYTALRRSVPEGILGLGKRLANVESERAFIKECLSFGDTDDIFIAEHSDRGVEDRVWTRIREESRYNYDGYQERLSALRLETDEYETEKKELKEKPQEDRSAADISARSADFDRLIEANKTDIERLSLERNTWQFVRECVRGDPKRPSEVMRKKKDETVTAAGVEEYFERARRNVIDRLRNRLAELDEVERYLKDCVAVTEPMAGATCTFHVSYRLTGGEDRWFFIPVGTQHKRLYVSLLDHVKADVKESEDEFRFVWESRATWSSDAGKPDAYTPLKTIEDCWLGDVFKIPGATLVTEQDSAPRWGMPNASLTTEGRKHIRSQASEFLLVLRSLATEDWASVPNRMLRQTRLYLDDYEWVNRDVKGHSVRSFAYGQTAANKHERNVLVHMMDRHSGSASQTDNIPDFYVFTDGNGIFPMEFVTRERAFFYVRVEAAKFDENGRINTITTHVPGGGGGSVQKGWEKAEFFPPKGARGYYNIVPMFKGRKGQIVGRTMPFAGTFKQNSFKILNGLSNSNYKRVHFRYDPRMGVGVYHIEGPLGVKFLYKDSVVQDHVAFYLNNSPGQEGYRGIGYGPGSKGWPKDKTHVLDLRTAVAADMFNVNESRLEALRRKNIILNFYEDLHSQAKGLLAEMAEARGKNLHDKAVVAATRVTALERRSYTPVRNTTNDMVVAVTVLLLLTLPFAFSCQNLMLASYSVYRMIAGFIVFFVASFVILYFTHPAFAFAPTPIIIFLAFFIIVMSAVVIWIIADKFTHEVKKLQGLATAAHTFQRSFLGNIGAAVNLAFSTMRRRPVRTGLTVVTALLLTFTILSFVAFQSEKGISRFFLGSRDEDSVTRLLIHRKVWKSMDNDVINEVKADLGEDVVVHGRYWRVRELTLTMNMEDLYIPIRRIAGGTSVAGAMMTLDPIELGKIKALRDALPGRIEEFAAGKGVYLPSGIADDLKVQPGDDLLVDGVAVKHLGVFDSRKLLSVREIDGSPILPVNIGMTQLAIGKFQRRGSAGAAANPLADLEAELAQLEAGALEPVSPDSLVIVPPQFRKQFEMKLRGIVIYPKKGEDLDAMASRLAILHDDGVYLNKGGEATFMLYGEKFGVSGTTDVIIPLILGGLIVFSTMLGSVIDREKEIYTFSALGLAPRNIAMLFFVEAGIYAVIGGFGGYLMSQGVTGIMEVLASYGIYKAPEMNYSSSAAIMTILIVMATVIISTIYPAVQAARKATAETSRRWRVPAPQGNVLEFDFPFTISRFDITGIICFIREHFVNHADRTVGKFAADHLLVDKDEEHGMAQLGAVIWLQPFDQGISQKFQLIARPSEIEEVCEVHICIERLSGPPTAWRRSNSLYLEDLRAQFLLWRTLDDDVREHYLSVADKEEERLGIAIAESAMAEDEEQA